MYVFADDMVIYLENQKEFAKLPEVINEFSKISGHKVNLQKHIAL